MSHQHSHGRPTLQMRRFRIAMMWSVMRREVPKPASYCKQMLNKANCQTGSAFVRLIGTTLSSQPAAPSLSAGTSFEGGQIAGPSQTAGLCGCSAFRERSGLRRTRNGHRSPKPSSETPYVVIVSTRSSLLSSTLRERARRGRIEQPRATPRRRPSSSLGSDYGCTLHRQLLQK